MSLSLHNVKHLLCWELENYFNSFQVLNRLFFQTRPNTIPIKPLPIYNLFTKTTLRFFSTVKILILGERATTRYGFIVAAATTATTAAVLAVFQDESLTKPLRHASRRQRRETLSEIEIPPPLRGTDMHRIPVHSREWRRKIRERLIRWTAVVTATLAWETCVFDIW